MKEIGMKLLSVLCGWAILTYFSFLPLYLEMPIFRNIKIGGNAERISQTYTYDAGLFTQYMKDSGNLLAGSSFMYNEKDAYFTVNDELHKIDGETMKSEWIASDMHAVLNFCDEKYAISSSYTNSVYFAKTGSGLLHLYEYEWELPEDDSSYVHTTLSRLLSSSNTEELTFAQMVTLVGYAHRGTLIGWDGQRAVFKLEGRPGTKVIQIYQDGKLVNLYEYPYESVTNAMVCGHTALFLDHGIVNAMDLETGVITTLSDPSQTAVHLNYMGKDNRNIVMWVTEKGLYTIDLDYGNQNFIEGDWITGYEGLYVWKDRMFLIRTDGGYQSWQYKLSGD